MSDRQRLKTSLLAAKSVLNFDSLSCL